MPPDTGSHPDEGPAKCWHYVLDGAPFGPTTARDLAELATRGVVDASTLVWREGWENWREAGDVAELRGVIPESGPAGRSAADNTGAVPAGFAPVRASVPDGAALRLCVLRAAAALIDQLILLVPTVVAVLPVFFVMVARGMTADQMQRLSPADGEWWLLFATVWSVQWVYAALTESSVLMGTVGKRVCGLRVVDAGGRRLGFGRASARYWGKVLSTPFLFGYVAALMFRGRRGVHDLIAGTVVVEAGRG